MKSPLKLITVLGLLAVCASAHTAHAKSGVRIKLPRRHAAVLAVASQPELDASTPMHGVPYMPEISQWCDDIAAILGEELSNAGMSMQMGDLAGAKQILDRALREAAASIHLNPSLRKPMTLVMIGRGITLSRALDRVMGNSRPELLAKVNFLSGFVQLVIAKSNEMDSSYYLPYYYQYGACGGHCPAEFDFGAFQNRVIEFGAALLQFTYEHLTIETSRGTFPAGDPRAFLKAAELVSAYVAQDVTMTLGSYANACVIADLKRLSRRVAAFNNGHGGYPNYPIAVAVVKQELEYAASNLGDVNCAR